MNSFNQMQPLEQALRFGTPTVAVGAAIGAVCGYVSGTSISADAARGAAIAAAIVAAVIGVKAAWSQVESLAPLQGHTS